MCVLISRCLQCLFLVVAYDNFLLFVCVCVCVSVSNFFEYVNLQLFYVFISDFCVC